MKNFERKNLLFSQCGLNCGLCPMRVDGYCPGCGGGEGNQPCAVARCSREHPEIAYCFECGQFPCDKYQDADAFDSFIPHRNRMKDTARAQKIGMEAYRKEQISKMEILYYLLGDYNDGRRKSFFCTAVNLLSLADLESVAEELREKTELFQLPVKQRAAAAVSLLQDAAERCGISLKLNKKPKIK